MVAVLMVAPCLLTREPLDTLVSLETSLARMVTPKTAARQATVRTDPTTTAAFMLLTEPSTLESCPLREDTVDLLSASMIVVWCVCLFVCSCVYELVFVKVRLSFRRILLKYPLRQSIKIGGITSYRPTGVPDATMMGRIAQSKYIAAGGI